MSTTPSLPGSAAGRVLRALLPFLAVALTVGLLYGHTLHVPWYLDDMPVIVENPQVHDLGLALRNLLRPRGLALFSFALNHRFGGPDPFGFHLVNILIHAACGGVVLLLLRRIFPGRQVLPLFGALLFVAHPLQTESVTYLVQRMTSLSALGLLLCLLLFARSREALAAGAPFSSPKHLGCWLGAFFAALFALGVKENAVVLPLALLLFARFFSPGERRWRPLLISLAPFFAASAVVMILLFFLPLLRGKELATLAAVQPLASLADNSPLRYLFTEFSVLWVYLRLIVFPRGLALEHGYPLVATLANVPSLAAGAGLLLLGGLAWRLRASRPRIAFGIAWFFLTLAVESSVLPLDPLFEHRLYLPLFGTIVIVLDLAAALPRTVLLGGAAVLLALLGLSSWQRNALWNDPLAFYAQNLADYPQSERALVNYYSACFFAGRYAEGAAVAERVLALNPDSTVVHRDLARFRIEQGRSDEALPLIEEGLRRNPAAAVNYNILAQVRMLQRRPDLARQALLSSLAIKPAASTYLNLGVACEQLGRLGEAEARYRAAAALTGSDPLPWLYLARLLRAEGRLAEARETFRVVLRCAASQSAISAEAASSLRQLGGSF